MRNNKIFKYGGIVASVMLIAFGAGSIAIGGWGINNVRDNLGLEQITGSGDMTPSAIKAEAKEAGLTGVSLPSCNVAGKSIDTGSEARCFASYMRIHTLEATGGYPYSQIGRYQALPNAPKSELAAGGGTDNDKFAVTDPKTKQPVANGIRNIWVTETALTTALNQAYFGERVGVFGIVVGVALLLTGIGFLVLMLIGGALEPATTKEPESARHPATATN
jgi:hypothetical protein